MSYDNPPVIQDLPVAPQRGQPQQTFTQNANAFTSALAPWQTDLEALATWMRSVGDTVRNDRDTAKAARDAAQTAESNASASESAAADSATAAATSESNAATSESNAADSASAAATSETNAASSASDAASSASAAATSETNAAQSESNAAASESAAATSASEASDSATAAFDARQQAEGAEAAASSSASSANAAAETALGAGNFAGKWSNLGGSLSVPASVLHNGQYWILVNDLGDVTASEPSASNSDWSASGEVFSRAPAVLDGLRRSVEAGSGGRMTVFYTDKGQPSYFVRQPKFLCENIAPGGELGNGVHEAFVFPDGSGGTVEDAEIWIGAYQAAVIDGEAVSQPGLAPEVSIDYDESRSACQAAGSGFDLVTTWDWAAIALWCMANGFQPRGNTDHGRHHDNRWETGARQDNGTPGDSSGTGNILTGSGPDYWRHDGSMAGISDLAGNVWEWVGGLKSQDGVVLLADNNGILDESNYTDTGFTISDANPWSSLDATGAGDALKRSLTVPNGAQDPDGRLYTNNSGERLPGRGGARGRGAFAGLGALNLSYGRGLRRSGIGFRPRFRNP